MKCPAAMLLSLFSLCLMASCSKGGAPAETPPENPANPSVSLPQTSVTEEGNLSLSKDGLEKEFLLQASFIDQGDFDVIGTPSFWGTQSRVVFFTQRQNALFLMESTKGLLASDELPAAHILAEFKIIKNEEGKIVFDFNEGMKKVFVVGDWYGSDFGKELPPQRALDVTHSFLKEVQQQKNRIVIRQVTQLYYRQALILPVEVVYYLEPYQPSPSFKPVVNPGFEKIGFFEANPLVRPEFGSLQTFIAKWNFEKPVVYYLSNNTPPEFQDAVKEGILYWNKAFGAEVLRVDMAPKGIGAPNPDYNLIQWVTNHDAGFAYADAQMDPKTGEILHAQVFFPTGWVVPHFDEFDRMEKTQTDVEEEPASASASGPETETAPSATDPLQLGLKGFASGLLCQLPRYKDLPTLMTLEGASKKIPLKLTQDLVRLVIAHEVGHTLGLRHNFAGSLSSQISPDDIAKAFETYLKTGELKDPKRVTSSVMDYSSLMDDIINGAYIGSKEGGALPYDAMAIQWAYFGVEPKKDPSKVLFCTDSQVRQYDDCKRWDGASHPVLSNAVRFEQDVKNLPSRIAQHYLLAKTYFDPVERKPVEEVALDAGDYAWLLARPLERLLYFLKADLRLLSIERMFPVITDVNEEAVYKATTHWLDKGIASGGGARIILDFLRSHTLYTDIANYANAFDAIIDREGFREGTDAFGQPYQFSDAEVAKMKKMGRAFFDMLQDKLIRRITQVLSPMPASPQMPTSSGISLPPRRSLPFRDIADIQGLEESLGKWAEFLITDHAEQKPTFEGDLRLLATGIVTRSDQGPTPTWQQANRQSILSLLLSKLEARYGVPFDKLDPNSLAPELREAYGWELRIVEALSPPLPKLPENPAGP